MKLRGWVTSNQKIKYVEFFVLILSLCVLLFSQVCYGAVDPFDADRKAIEQRKEEFGEDLFYCQTDLDCEWVETACCPTPGMAIAKNYQDRWNAMRTQICQNKYACPAVVMHEERDIPKCLQGRCQLAKADFSNVDAAICHEVVRMDERDWCYFDTALKAKSPFLCSQISSEYHRGDCLWQLLGTGQPTLELCATIDADPQISFRDDCWERLAEGARDFRYCQKIHNDQLKGRCYDDMITYADDPAACDHFDPGQITAYYRYGQCIQAAAYHARDINLCDRIADNEQFYDYWFNCIVAIARLQKDTSLCQQLSLRKHPSHYSEAFSVSGCVRKVESGSF